MDENNEEYNDEFHYKGLCMVEGGELYHLKGRTTNNPSQVKRTYCSICGLPVSR